MGFGEISPAANGDRKCVCGGGHYPGGSVGIFGILDVAGVKGGKMRPAEIRRYMKDALHPTFMVTKYGRVSWAGQRIDPRQLTPETQARFGLLIPLQIVVRQKTEVVVK